MKAWKNIVFGLIFILLIGLVSSNAYAIIPNKVAGDSENILFSLFATAATSKQGSWTPTKISCEPISNSNNYWINEGCEEWMTKKGCHPSICGSSNPGGDGKNPASGWYNQPYCDKGLKADSGNIKDRFLNSDGSTIIKIKEDCSQKGGCDSRATTCKSSVICETGFGNYYCRGTEIVRDAKFNEGGLCKTETQKFDDCGYHDLTCDPNMDQSLPKCKEEKQEQTCSQKGGNICEPSDGLSCSGNLAIAKDTNACCLASCWTTKKTDETFDCNVEDPALTFLTCTVREGAAGNCYYSFTDDKCKRKEGSSSSTGSGGTASECKSPLELINGKCEKKTEVTLSGKTKGILESQLKDKTEKELEDSKCSRTVDCESRAKCIDFADLPKSVQNKLSEGVFNIAEEGICVIEQEDEGFDFASLPHFKLTGDDQTDVLIQYIGGIVLLALLFKK